MQKNEEMKSGIEERNLKKQEENIIVRNQRHNK